MAKAISAFAGKKTDVAVWDKGMKITGCETEGTRSQCNLKGEFPNYARVIPADEGCSVKIAAYELKRLREFVRANMGKNKTEKKNRYAVVHAAKNDADTIQIRMMETVGYEDANELASEYFNLSECATHYAQIAFNAELFYYAIQEDFNGQIWAQENRAVKFLGEMRQSILMPTRIEGVDCYIND